MKLTSDGSYIEWGFRVDEIWPSTNEPIPEAFISGVYITLLNPGTVFLDNTEMF